MNKENVRAGESRKWGMIINGHKILIMQNEKLRDLQYNILPINNILLYTEHFL